MLLGRSTQALLVLSRWTYQFGTNLSFEFRSMVFSRNTCHKHKPCMSCKVCTWCVSWPFSFHGFTSFVWISGVYCILPAPPSSGGHISSAQLPTRGWWATPRDLDLCLFTRTLVLNWQILWSQQLCWHPAQKRALKVSVSVSRRVLFSLSEVYNCAFLSFWCFYFPFHNVR